MSRTRLFAALLLAVVALAWGAIPLIVRGDVPWQQLLAARLWLGALTLLAIVGLGGRLRLPAVRDRWRLIACGLLLAAHWGAFFLSITEATVAIALAVLYLGPVLASALAPFVLGESVPGRVFVGLGVAVVGVLAVVRPGGETSALGLAASVFAALSLTALMLVGAGLSRRIGPLTMATGETMVAALATTPWAVAAVRESSEYWPQLLVLGVLLTGIASVVYWRGMERLPVATVSVIMYLEPASAVVWAAIFLGETPDALAWIGIALVIVGGLLAGSASAREDEASAREDEASAAPVAL